MFVAMFTQKCVAKSDTGGHGRGKKFDDNEFVLKQLEKDHLTIFMKSLPNIDLGYI